MNRELFLSCVLSGLSEYGEAGVVLFNKISRHIGYTQLGFGYGSYSAMEGTLSSKGIKLSKEESVWLAITIGKIEGFKDPLTGVLRRDIIPVIDKTLVSSFLMKSNFIGLALIYIDLDKFGEINKVYSQHSGDLVLKAVAKNLKSKIRKTDILIRIGGDEFLIILPKLKNEQDGLKFNEVLESFVGEGFEAGEVKLSSKAEDVIIKIKGSSGFAYLERSEVEKIVLKDHISIIDKLSIAAGERLLQNKKVDRKLHIRSVPRGI
ncbi:GGDEF domain-containing protein [Candidatus Saccharibacteria bacterium]|nr:GGDEF domain-containing protein [Candidatus Saccharibacteria bacterium]